MLKKEYISIHISCKNVVEARKIAGHCVSERLAACANIIPTMESFYWWDGTVNAETESILILKTVANRLDDVKAEVLKLHSYECPSIVAFSIVDGYDPYLQWINENTQR